jgi:hypothetical protein
MSTSPIQCPNCDSVRVRFLGRALSVPIHDDAGQPSEFVFNHVCRDCEEEFLADTPIPVMPVMPPVSDVAPSDKASVRRESRKAIAGQLSLLEGLTAPAILCA